MANLCGCVTLIAAARPSQAHERRAGFCVVVTHCIYMWLHAICTRSHERMRLAINNQVCLRCKQLKHTHAYSQLPVYYPLAFNRVMRVVGNGLGNQIVRGARIRICVCVLQCHMASWGPSVCACMCES